MTEKKQYKTSTVLMRVDQLGTKAFKPKRWLESFQQHTDRIYKRYALHIELVLTGKRMTEQKAKTKKPKSERILYGRWDLEDYRK